MKKYYERKLRCVTCAGEDFEFNKDKSYIKCTTCGREYFGGCDELVEYNQDVQEEVIRQVQEEVKKVIESEFQRTFKNIKEIRIK